MVTDSEEQRISVHTLLGKRQLSFSLRCLSSLLTHCRDGVALVLHDDGTLESADWQLLHATLHPAVSWPRSEANERIDPLLAKHPRCLAFRRSHVFGPKLFDGVLGGEGDHFHYADSDILFIRPFHGLFQPLESAYGALFMHDRQNAYALRPWQLMPPNALRVPGHINSGIVVLRRSQFDLDFIEWALARLDSGYALTWHEQTVWALLGGRISCRVLDPDQFIIPTPGTALPPGAIGLHWVSSVRQGLETFSESPFPSAPATALSAPSSRCGALHLLGDGLRRRLPF
ncbi:MAG: hypothetical protein KJ058_06380 [Thermoanaerobaculia bacterium]|nr:hypothetical protein [Thermoanaerobaculia bacterium]